MVENRWGKPTRQDEWKERKMEREKDGKQEDKKEGGVGRLQGEKEGRCNIFKRQLMEHVEVWLAS